MNKVHLRRIDLHKRLGDGPRLCHSCRETLPGTDFRPRNPWICRKCRNVQEAAWRAANRESLKDKARRYYHNNRIPRAKKLIGKYKEGKPCADCGVVYPPEVMDFDHVRANKSFSLGLGFRIRKEADIEIELAKCELVCANCHRIRTVSRRRSV